MPNIRPARPDDADAICAIWNPIIADTTVTFTTILHTPDGIRDMIASRPIFLVATDAHDHATGFATYAQFRSGPGYARCAEHSVILSPAARGQGLGRALLTAVEDHARSAGFHTMIAGISGSNPAAIAFHAACGFATVGQLPQVGHKDGQYLDLVLMHKLL